MFETYIFIYTTPTKKIVYRNDIIQINYTHASSDPVCRYLFLSMVRYFDAESLKDHLSRQTVENAGCSVIHSGAVVMS